MQRYFEFQRKITALKEEGLAILDKADSEKRNLSDEENTKLEEFKAEKQKTERTRNEYVEAKGLQSEIANLGKRDALKPDPEGKNAKDDDAELRSHSFMKWMRQGRNGLSDIENRALVEDATGQILVPEDIMTEIIRVLPGLTVMRGLVTPRTTTRDRVRIRSLTEVSMGWGKLETGSDVTETIPVPAEDWMYVEDLTGLAKIGRDELQDTDYNLKAFIADSFARARAETEDTAFAIGTGHANQQPDGIAVDAHITNVNLATADAIVVNDLINLVYTLPAKYRKNASFLMNSQTEKAVRYLRAEVSAGYYGDYLWQPNVQAGKPNSLLGYPVYNQDDMNYPADEVVAKNIIFGDFKAGYRILDKAQMSIARLDELYAESGLVGFLAYFRVGGGVVRTNAFRALYNNT